MRVPKKKFPVIISAIALIFFSSCNESLIQVTKRQYRDGYYIVLNTFGKKTNVPPIINNHSSKFTITENALQEKQKLIPGHGSGSCFVKPFPSEKRILTEWKKNVFSIGSSKKNVPANPQPEVHRSKKNRNNYHLPASLKNNGRDIPYTLHVFFVVFGILCFLSGMVLILSPLKLHLAVLYGGILMLLFIACWILASQDSIGNSNDDF